MEHIGGHWRTSEHIGGHWNTLEHIGKHWKTLENIGTHEIHHHIFLGDSLAGLDRSAGRGLGGALFGSAGEDSEPGRRGCPADGDRL